MSQHQLEALFSPQSVAVFGASDKTDSVGQIVFHNLLQSGFKGGLYPVNPKHASVQGCPSFATIEAIPADIELAVVTTPAHAVPGIIEACGKRNVKAVVIITAGFSEIGEEGKRLEKALLDNARRYGMRLLGPNCLGVMRPEIGLNATFNNGNATPGHLAFVSQSGALCTAILDWAKSNRVGFSNVVSLGDSADVDFGEILDYLITDVKTRSILLYIEGIRDARSFMSALRAAARIKPVILVKVGRHAAGSKAARSHTAALVGADDAFDAAVRRAGAVRVQTVTQLFSVAKALSCGFQPTGKRLAIVTNGGGPGVLAADCAEDVGVVLAELSETTLQRLDQVLPPTWPRANPVDVIGDAQAERYRHAVQACLEDDNVDGVLAILTPQAMTKPLEVAHAVIDVSNQYSKPFLACWMGGETAENARAAFNQAKKPNFRTPEPAVEVFSFLSAYDKNQRLLRQAPPSLSHHLEPDLDNARIIIDSALQAKRKVLGEMESKALLSAFHIPVAKTMIARSADEALLIAQQLGYPVAMKINSPDITHKTDVGGVRLNLRNAQAVRGAYHDLLEQVSQNRPDARLDGLSIEPMISRPNGRELMIGVTSDPVFGPVITFGMGGTAVEVLGDRAVSLPPLNAFLAKDLIRGTRVAKMLGAFRQMPPVNFDALESVLLRVSEMVCELPALVEMDINPLIVDEQGAFAADARIMVDFYPGGSGRYSHMAIYPYPAHLVSTVQLANGVSLVIRPIRPEDAQIEKAFVRNLSEESCYFRFMDHVKELSETMLARFTQIDYSREMALIAVGLQQGREVELGVARYSINPDGESCDFAIAVADAMQGKGLGHKLMQALMEAAADAGLKIMQGDVLHNNANMLELMRRMDFTLSANPDDATLISVQKKLQR